MRDDGTYAQLRAALRIKRFEQLGGVPLGDLDPEERKPLLAEIRIGIAHLRRAQFWFVCPICGNRIKGDQEMSPLCTGSSWTDDHPHEVMVLER